MRITVTQIDIDHGVMKSAMGCPVARAIQRQTGDCGATTGRTTVVTGARIYYLPQIATKFVEAFDNGLTLKPIEFDLLESQA